MGYKSNKNATFFNKKSIKHKNKAKKNLMYINALSFNSKPNNNNLFFNIVIFGCYRI